MHWLAAGRCAAESNVRSREQSQYDDVGTRLAGEQRSLTSRGKYTFVFVLDFTISNDTKRNETRSTTTVAPPGRSLCVMRLTTARRTTRRCGCTMRALCLLDLCCALRAYDLYECRAQTFARNIKQYHCLAVNSGGRPTARLGSDRTRDPVRRRAAEVLPAAAPN